MSDWHKRWEMVKIRAWDRMTECKEYRQLWYSLPVVLKKSYRQNTLLLLLLLLSCKLSNVFSIRISKHLQICLQNLHQLLAFCLCGCIWSWGHILQAGLSWWADCLLIPSPQRTLVPFLCCTDAGRCSDIALAWEHAGACRIAGHSDAPWAVFHHCKRSE